MPNYCKVAKCPYYINHDASKSRWKSYISCRIIHDNLGFNIKNVLKFGDIDDIAAWMDMFCCDFRFCDCVYYQAITTYGGGIKNEDSGEKVKKRAEQTNRSRKISGNKQKTNSSVGKKGE